MDKGARMAMHANQQLRRQARNIPQKRCPQLVSSAYCALSKHIGQVVSFCAPPCSCACTQWRREPYVRCPTRVACLPSVRRSTILDVANTTLKSLSKGQGVDFAGLTRGHAYYPLLIADTALRSLKGDNNRVEQGAR